MSFIFKSQFLGASGLWGITLKLSLILACVGIVLLIVWSRRHNLICKACGKRVGTSERYCKNCGTHLTDATTTATVGIGKKARTAGILATALMLCIFTVSVVAVTQNITIGNLATGVYSGYHQLYTQNDTMWGVACKSALSEGAFKHLISEDNLPGSLTVSSSSDSGTLILTVQQNGAAESYDISNTDGSQSIELGWLTAGEDVQLSVEHTPAENVWFEIAWE